MGQIARCASLPWVPRTPTTTFDFGNRSSITLVVRNLRFLNHKAITLAFGKATCGNGPTGICPEGVSGCTNILVSRGYSLATGPLKYSYHSNRRQLYTGKNFSHINNVGRRRAVIVPGLVFCVHRNLCTIHNYVVKVFIFFFHMRIRTCQ